jgi:hypothetical protein
MMDWKLQLMRSPLPPPPPNEAAHNLGHDQASNEGNNVICGFVDKIDLFGTTPSSTLSDVAATEE